MDLARFEGIRGLGIAFPWIGLKADCRERDNDTRVETINFRSLLESKPLTSSYPVLHQKSAFGTNPSSLQRARCCSSGCPTSLAHGRHGWRRLEAQPVLQCFGYQDIPCWTCSVWAHELCVHFETHQLRGLVRIRQLSMSTIYSIRCFLMIACETLWGLTLGGTRLATRCRLGCSKGFDHPRLG